MPHGERLLNLALGVSVLSWAVFGLAEEWSAHGQPGAVRLVIAALNLTVGILFLTRSPVAANGSPSMVLASLPGLLVAGWALAEARPLHSWPAHACWMFGLGAGFSIFAFSKLGRSFAILPALRDKIVTRGPYRLLRHPAYTGELVMVAACGIAAWHPAAFWPAMLATPLVVVRILAEERLLRQSPDYQRYAEQVRWRLCPGIW